MRSRSKRVSHVFFLEKNITNSLVFNININNMLSLIINAVYEGSNCYTNDCKNILHAQPTQILYFLYYFATFENPKKKVFYCVSVVKKSNPY